LVSDGDFANKKQIACKDALQGGRENRITLFKQQ
jgi:hypothetical protein